MRSLLVLLGGAVAEYRCGLKDHDKDPAPGWSIVFKDMHDGDMKKVTFGAEMASVSIEPHGNDQKWRVEAQLDDQCVASIDFRVEGKPSPPPGPLSASFGSFVAFDAYDAENGQFMVTFEDPIGKIGHGTLNMWVQDSTALASVDAPLQCAHAHQACDPGGRDFPKIDCCPGNTCYKQTFEGGSYICLGGTDAAETSVVPARNPPCGLTGKDGVFQDMHDGDQKHVTWNDTHAIITPHGNGQKWVVYAPLSSACAATVDFNVPGKLSPPPVPIRAIFGFFASASIMAPAAAFTDPSGELGKGALNTWIFITGDELRQRQHVLHV